MTDPTLRTMPGHLIRRLHQLSTQVFAAAMAQAGEDLTPVQFTMMDALAAEPGLDQASLARAIGKDRATVGAVAERLAKKGLIARTASAHDRRAIELALTGPEAAAGMPGSRPWRRRDLTLASVLTDNRGNLAVHRQGA